MLRIPPRRTSGFGPARFASPRRPRTTIAVYKFGVPPLTTGAGQCGAGSRTASLEAGYVSGAHVTAIVELAFGKIKQGRGFRQFLFRAMRKRRGDWALIVHHRLTRTSSPHRGLDRPRYKASCASASCGCHAEFLLIEYECGSREGTRRAQSHVEEGRSLGLRTEWKRAHGPRTVGTSRTGGRRPASPICVRKTWRTRQRTTNNEGTLSHSFNAGLLI